MGTVGLLQLPACGQIRNILRMLQECVTDFRLPQRCNCSSLFSDFTWRRLGVRYRRFGTTSRSHLQAYSSPLFDPWRWEG